MGSWWRTMRIRQTKLPPFAVRCVSCQEPYRFSQNLESQSQPRRFYYAQLGEPLCHRGTTDYTDVTDGTFELRHTFGIWPSAFSKQFPPKVPPKQFPRATAFAAARVHTPSWMAMGMVRPRQQSNQTIRKQLKTPTWPPTIRTTS